MLAIEEMLERTDTEWGPWTIVEATDRRWTRVKIFQTIVGHIEEALDKRGVGLPVPREDTTPSPAESKPEAEE